MKAMVIDPTEAAASGPEATYAATPALHHGATSRQSNVTGPCRSGATHRDPDTPASRVSTHRNPGTPASRVSTASLGKRGRQQEQHQRRAE